MKKFFVLALAFFAPMAATAGQFTPPKGCTAYLTVQMKSCEVTHYWTCKNDQKGDHWTLTIHNEGPTFLQHLDREFRWLKGYPQNSDITRELIENETDANSLTELLETGRDDFDFQQSVMQNGVQIGIDQITGYDRLNGSRVTIDGEPLLVTEFEITMDSGNGFDVTRTTGNQFVSERFRLFFQGRETETSGGKTTHYDDTPVLFIEPGEAGFLADRPEYGCDAMMSALPFEQQENLRAMQQDAQL